MATKGFVNGKYFNSGREMVEMIYRIYFDNNPTITLVEFEQELINYNFSSRINDSNDRSFLKSEASYNALGDDLKKRFYSPNVFVIGGNKYYLKTETGEPDTSEHKRFAHNHGINVTDNNCMSTSVSINNQTVRKLKGHNDELISFYIAETKSVLSQIQYEDLSNIKVVIDKSNDIYFEIIGRYDLREIIEEIKTILEGNRHLSDLTNVIEELLQLLYQLLDIEYSCQNRNENTPFLIENGIHYISRNYRNNINEIESNIKAIMDKIKEMLESHNWPIETRKLIEYILNIIFPKIISRKRISSVLGTFTASKFLITLYEKAIKEWLPNVELDKKMLNVYSHELFHAYHYVHMQGQGKWAYDDESRIVKESLARYIEYKFGMFNIHETTITSDLIRMWNNYDMFDFPYAGAKFVEHFSGLCELMFKESIIKGTKETFHLIETASKI